MSEQQARPRRRPRGDWYATAIETREDGKRFGREVARQAPTLRAAARALNESGLPGYVQKWVHHRGQRVVVADRHGDGTWTSLNPYTGEHEPITDPGAPRPEQDR